MIPNNGDAVIYVDNEGVEYPAHLLSLNGDASESAELYVKGERGDWTVINVPHAERTPQQERPGAYWKFEQDEPLDADRLVVVAREPENDQLVARAQQKKKARKTRK